MAHTVNHNLVLGCPVENQVWIGRSDHSPHTPAARHLTDLRMVQKQVDDCLNAFMNAARALRGMLGDMIEYAFEVGECFPRIA
jgi:hypothetical protein